MTAGSTLLIAASLVLVVVGSLIARRRTAEHPEIVAVDDLPR